jgi:hypothetical protein
MTALRAFFRKHAALAMLIVVAAIGLRALMPTGYMASASAGGMTIELCSGVAGQSIVVALPGAHHSDDGDHGKGRADSPCAFSGLSGGALSAVDPFILAIAIAFVMATVFRQVVSVIAAPPAFLRPPLRGPPASV